MLRPVAHISFRFFDKTLYIKLANNDLKHYFES